MFACAISRRCIACCEASAPKQDDGELIYLVDPAQAVEMPSFTTRGVRSTCQRAAELVVKHETEEPNENNLRPGLSEVKAESPEDFANAFDDLLLSELWHGHGGQRLGCDDQQLANPVPVRGAPCAREPKRPVHSDAQSDAKPLPQLPPAASPTSPAATNAVKGSCVKMKISPTSESKTKTTTPIKKSIPVVSCLEEGLSFTDYYLDEIANMSPDKLPDAYDSGLELLADRVASDYESDSTSFSGVEAPHCSRKMIRNRLQARLGRPIPMAPLLHVVEWNNNCQTELFQTLDDEKDTTCCVFGDICSFFRDELTTPGGLIDGLRRNPALAVEALAPLLEQGKLVKRSAWCLRHGSLVNVIMS